MGSEEENLQPLRQEGQDGAADQDPGLGIEPSERRQPAGQIHAGADHGELHPLARTQVAGHHLAEMEADVLVKGGLARRRQLGVEGPEARLYGQDGPHGRQGLLRITSAEGQAELRSPRSSGSAGRTAPAAPPPRSAV